MIRFPIRQDNNDLRAMPAVRTEQWLPVIGYENLYEVSDLGRVRSLHARFAEPRPCKFGTDQTGYPTVMLSKEGTRKPFTVHRLVALAFTATYGTPFTARLPTWTAI